MPGIETLSPTLTGTDNPPGLEPARTDGGKPPCYVIDGRPPGHRFATIEDACEAAADFMLRLRLVQPVRIRVAGTDTFVARVERNPEGNPCMVLV